MVSVVNAEAGCTVYGLSKYGNSRLDTELRINIVVGWPYMFPKALVSKT